MININNYYKWYFIPKVKFNIIRYTKNRETALISHDKKITLRMLKIHSVQHLDFHLKNLNWFKIKWNMYYSLAQYKNGIPKQHFNLAKRDNSEWKKDHWQSMIGYDLLIDVDASDHSEMDHAKRSAIKIAERLMKYDLKFNIVFSGCGFHLVVPYKVGMTEDSFDPHAEENIYSRYALIIKQLNYEYSEMVDINLNDSRRLCKIPYSLAIYEKNIYMCCPINFEQLTEFKLKDYTPENAFKWLDDKHPPKMIPKI